MARFGRKCEFCPKLIGPRVMECLKPLFYSVIWGPIRTKITGELTPPILGVSREADRNHKAERGRISGFAIQLLCEIRSVFSTLWQNYHPDQIKILPEIPAESAFFRSCTSVFAGMTSTRMHFPKIARYPSITSYLVYFRVVSFY